MSPIRFAPEPMTIKHAIAASFDMSGFSPFCRRPDAHACLTPYLAALFDAFDQAFKDPIRDIFQDNSKLIQAPRPDFAKFTGDGALLLWVRDSGAAFSDHFCASVVAALRAFQINLPDLVTQWERKWHVTGLPKQGRLGLATGPVQPLGSQTYTLIPTVTDYAGYCINLAVRLADHCPSVGFIIHGALWPKLGSMIIPLEAKGMKGTLVEPVYVFASDYEHLCATAPKEARAKFNVP